MNKPLISCVILCYNYGKYLQKAIESCLMQTLDKSFYEILVIDDGSTDNTQEICAMYKQSIRISRTENMGFSKSLERGLREAKGTYVAYMDADDWWHEDKLKKVQQVLSENVLAVAHNLLSVDSFGNSLKKIGARGNTSSVCIHREAGLTLMPATSEIFCQPFFRINKGVYLDDDLGYYRIHDNAMTDRSIDSKHTEFFANTNRILAENLNRLVDNIPFWANNKKQILELANHYTCEYFIKSFERSTEVNTNMFQSWWKMMKIILSKKESFGKRELKLTIRMVLQILKIKSHKNIFNKNNK